MRMYGTSSTVTMFFCMMDNSHETFLDSTLISHPHTRLFSATLPVLRCAALVCVYVGKIAVIGLATLAASTTQLVASLLLIE